MNIIEIFEKFPTQQHCIQHLEKKRWGDKPVCPYCGSFKINSYKNYHRHHCNGCRKSFSVTVRTVFHDTKVPLQKWFLLISLMLNAKKGISACQAARDLNMNRPTVWYMMHRIRRAMKEESKLLSGIVEMDETYIGGKPRKGKKKGGGDDDKGNPRGRGTQKTPVVGMVERGGRVKAVQTPKGRLTSQNLNELVKKNISCKGDTVLITDEYRGYRKVRSLLEHYTINHQCKYVNGAVHTNTIESFWAILKRGILGQYHKVSKKYLDMYLNEFCFRYNRRNKKKNFAFNDIIFNMVKN